MQPMVKPPLKTVPYSSEVDLPGIMKLIEADLSRALQYLHISILFGITGLP